MPDPEHLKILKQDVKTWNKWREENPHISPDLMSADLGEAKLYRADLSEANLSDSNLGGTTFGDVDLNTVSGLESITHWGPSTIGIDTIFRSAGKIPHKFLEDAGVPNVFIEYMGSLTGQVFQYYSCFISHSTNDKEFADRIHADLQKEGVRVALNDVRAVFHRPHPKRVTNKGSVKSVRRFLIESGVKS